MSATHYGVSCWLAGVARERRPAWGRLRKDAELDVVILGGGMAGCMAAYLFAQAGLQPALVEAGRIAQGATAEGPGLFDPGAGARFADLRDRHGLKVARHLWNAARLASLDAQALVRRLRIPCGLTREDVTDVALVDSDAIVLEREHKALVEAGFEASWLTGARVREATGLVASEALKRRDGAWADPYRLALGLARQAERRGAAIFELTPARRIKVARRHVEVVTEGGTLRAQTVVVATGLPQPGLGALHRHQRSVETTVAVVPPLRAAVRRGFGSGTGVVRDSAEPRHAWRLGTDGGLVVWQADQPALRLRQRDAAAIERTGELMYELSVLYPDLSGERPSYGWTTTAYRSLDGMVIAGPHRAFPRHLFAVGLGVDGLQGAYLAARVNLRQAQGAPEKGDELFGFLR